MSRHDDIVRPIQRRALLELLADIGGPHNDEELKLLLRRFGHRPSGRDVRADLQFLAGEDLVRVEALGDFLVAEITSDGRDAAAGDLQVDGVDKHRAMR